MKETFLKAKHWQLFLLTFGIPSILQFAFIGSLFVTLFKGTTANSDTSFIMNYLKVFPIIMVILVGVLFGWFWSVVIGLQQNIPGDAKMKLSRFKIFFFIPLIYMLFLSAAFGETIHGAMHAPGDLNPALIGGLMAVVFPLHLFSMFCMFHSLYFVAKTIKTVELQRKVSFSDFAGEFFMVWFFPIVVWILQPKINKIAGRNF